MAFRGYRMSEVDQLIDRVAQELVLRDQLIDELEAQRSTPPRDPRSDV
jgi:cell division septum initiation protein DivIVA